MKVQAGEILKEDGVPPLYVGDEVNLEFQDKGGKLVDPKVVAKAEHPERIYQKKAAE